MSGRERVFQLPVAGAALQVVGVGAADARPIVALHSGPGEAHDLLRPWLDALADREHQVIYYDQRGGGRSPLSPAASPPSWRDHVEDLRLILDHIGRRAPVLIGHSWGALLGLLFAVEHPGQVAGLVLVSPAPLTPEGQAQTREGERLSRARPEVVEAQAFFLREGLPFAAAIAPYLANPGHARDLPAVTRNEAAAGSTRKSLQGLRLLPRLTGLRGIPGLVIHGAQDPIPMAVADETSRALKARLEAIENCGHVPFFEQPERFLSAVQVFLRSLA